MTHAFFSPSLRIGNHQALKFSSLVALLGENLSFLSFFITRSAAKARKYQYDSTVCLFDALLVVMH